MFLCNIANTILNRPRLVTVLSGHTGSVVSLAFSRTGRLLASGGVDGVKVWDLVENKEISIPQQPFHERGQVSGLCWITRPDDVYETFCYGNATGFFVFLQYSPAEASFKVVHSCRVGLGGEILSMTVDVSSTLARIATGTRNKCLQVWDYDASTRILQPVFSQVHGGEALVPKSLAFANNPRRDVYAFGFYDGCLYKCDGQDGKILMKHQIGAQIGNAAVDVDHNICVVDNIASGFDVYTLAEGTFVRTLTVGKPEKTFPKSVAFANSSKAVVVGSDHGKAYIIDVKSGCILKKINHSKYGGVETISVYNARDGSALIATASVRDNFGSSPIRVWRWTPSRDKPASTRSIRIVMSWIWQVLVLCAAAAYVSQFMPKAYIQRGMSQVVTSPIEVTEHTGYTSDHALNDFIKEQIAQAVAERLKRDLDSVPAHAVTVSASEDRVEVEDVTGANAEEEPAIVTSTDVGQVVEYRGILVA